MGREEAVQVLEDLPQDGGHRVHLQSGREDHLCGGEVLLQGGGQTAETSQFFCVLSLQLLVFLSSCKL